MDRAEQQVVSGPLPHKVDDEEDPGESRHLLLLRYARSFHKEERFHVWKQSAEGR
jgi:hypothetical protein